VANPVPAAKTITAVLSGGTYTATITKDDLADLKPDDTVMVDLGGCSVEFPVSVLNDNMNNGTLTLTQASSPTTTLDKIVALVSSNGVVLTSFDLNLSGSSGSQSIHELGNTVKVTVKLTPNQLTQINGDKNARLFYYDPSTNSLKDMNASFNFSKGTVTFYTDHFSTYVIKTAKSASAGLSVWLLVLIIFIALVVVCAVVVLILWLRKKNRKLQRL
jgi:hypothetical protein